MHKPSIVAVAAIMLGAGFTLPAGAEVAAEDAAKYRQYIMRALSGHNGAVSLIARAKAGDPGNVGKHTAALVALAAEIGPAFEAAGGAPVEDTEALPAIWERPADFAAAVETFAAAVAALDAAAGGEDIAAVESAHRDVAAACKGCHEDFRLDD
ncbi:MAG: cytochrome c [Woeseiaceae bacterium]|nr:cytochrome c [Woeseiaceae bacterium]